MNTIVIYHGGCRDGFCAAWVVNKWIKEQKESAQAQDRVINAYENVEFFPGYYGQVPPNVQDKDVIIVDFAYDETTMAQIAMDCKSLVWIDHHKTAQPIFDFFEMLTRENVEGYNWREKLSYVFDMSRSGAGLAWDFFFPREQRPWLVDYVEDRDLWKKKLPSTDLINAYIACLPFEFHAWDNAESFYIDDVERMGMVAQMKTEQYVRETCKNVYNVNLYAIGDRLHSGRFMLADLINKPYKVYNIPVVNICQVDCSEVLHELCKKYPDAPFSLYWFKRHDGMYQYGLRSIGDFDVSEVAKVFGGGGHKNAAGFQLNYLLEELS